MENNKLESAVVEYLILEGAVEIAGMSEDGKRMFYNFTPKLKEVDPELYQDVQTYFNAGIMLLWQGGFVDFDPSSENPVVKLTDKSFDEKAVSKLGEHEKTTLESIILSFKRQE
jgi:hypothetical protein